MIDSDPGPIGSFEYLSDFKSAFIATSPGVGKDVFVGRRNSDCHSIHIIAMLCQSVSQDNIALAHDADDHKCFFLETWNIKSIENKFDVFVDVSHVKNLNVAL